MREEKAAKPLTLEEYAGFFHDSRLRCRFSHGQLNQIIYMHGFLRLHRWQKANIVEALNSLDLMQPERSTVREESSAAATCGITAAVLTLEEVKQDIQVLDWQECPLGSIITVRAAENVVEAPVPISSRLAPNPSVPSPAAAAADSARLEIGAKRKRKRKRKRMVALAEVTLRPSLPPPV